MASAAVRAPSVQRPPPLVFLDVDGVLHPTHGETFFEASCMANLRYIIEQTGAVIVLSSAWQVTESGIQDVNEVLKRWGIPPLVARTTNSPHVGRGEEKRAREIMAWVASHQMACSSGWVALDDLDLDSVAPPPSWAPILPAGRLVRTLDTVGLTQQDAVRAIKVLGGPNPRAAPLPPPQANATEPVLRGGATVGGREGANDGLEGHNVWRTDARYGR